MSTAVRSILTQSILPFALTFVLPSLDSAGAEPWKVKSHSRARIVYDFPSPPDFVVEFDIPKRSVFQVYATNSRAARTLNYSAISHAQKGNTITVFVEAGGTARSVGPYTASQSQLTAFAGSLRVRYQTFR